MNDPRAWILIPLLAGIAGFSPAAADDEPILLASNASGILALEGENKFAITGSNMTLSIRVGREDEFRFAARARTNRREERPVELWLEGRTLRIDRAEGDDGEPLVVEVALSPGLRVQAEMTDAVVSIFSLRDRVELKGDNLDVTVNGVGGAVTLELKNSSISVKSLSGDLELVGEGLEGSIDRVQGYANGTLTDSSIAMTELVSGTEFDMENSEVNLSRLWQEVRLGVNGGTLQVGGTTHGAEIEADNAVVMLQGTQGDIRVETNGETRFSEIGGNLTINAFGGKVIGSGVTGALRITGNGTEIVVDGLNGASQIDGSDLSISAKSVRGDLNLLTTASTLVIEDAAAALTIQADFGDVTVLRAGGQVKINSREGDVSVSGQTGGLEITAAGPQVEVSWQQVPRDKNAVIENTRGDIHLVFPVRAQCRVEAESAFGSVESSIEMVRVLDDGKRASGVLGRANRPLVQAKAGNTVYISGGGETTQPGG